jgi:hypothetical protein
VSPEIAIRPGVVANTVRHSVTRNGVEVFLSPQQFKIFLLISKARFGITPAQLFNLIYADSIDGGPLTGRKAVQVQRCNLNQKILPLGLRIQSAGSGYRDGVYELRESTPKQMLLSDFGFFDPPTSEDERA